MDPNQNQPQQIPQSQPAPLQDIQPQPSVASPVFTQPATESQQPFAQQVSAVQAAEPTMTNNIPQQVSQTLVNPAPITEQQPNSLPQMDSQPIQQMPQVTKKSKKKLIIILAASLLMLGAVAATLFLFVFNGSAEEKAVRGFYGAFNDKDCSKAVSYMAPSLYEGETKDEYIKYCEENKSNIFDNTGDIEILSLKKLSGDDKKATIEARMKDEKKEITVKISLIKTDGKWLLEDAETVE